MNSYRLVRILLTIDGCILCCATVAIFFSPELMATFHRGLGIGEFPIQPITVYLAKSTSMLYAIHGIVMLCVAARFDRLHEFVPILGWLHVVIGSTMIYIDVAAGMPWWWTWSEGPPVIFVGLLLTTLYYRARRRHPDKF